MNNLLTTKSSTIFLATLLIAAIISVSFPSFLTNAPAQQEYNGIDNRYNGYEPTREYSPQYAEKEYTSYEPSQYEKDTYETPPSYENENNY